MSSNAFHQQVRDDGIAEDQRAQAKAERYKDEIERRDALMNAADHAIVEMRMDATSLRRAGYISGAELTLASAMGLRRALDAFRIDADRDTAKKLAEFGGKL